MTRLNERVFERARGGARRRGAARRCSLSRSRWRRCARRSRSWSTDVFDSAQFDRPGAAARRVLHQRHAGRHADRSAARQHRPHLRRRPSSALRPGPGKAYFVETLLKDVMIGESGLAGVNRRLEARKAAVQLGAYVAAGLVAAAGVLRAVGQLQPEPRVPRAGTAPQVGALDKAPQVPPTVAARSRSCRASTPSARVVDVADRYRETTSWPMRWGLYQGRRSATRRATRTCASSIACCCRGSRRRFAPGSIAVRRRAREAVRLLQGIPDARGPDASGQGAPRRRSPIASGSRARAMPPRPGPRCRSISRALLDE